MPDTLQIQNNKAVLITDEGRKFERDEAQLMDMLRRELLPPVNGVALPDGVKFIEYREPVLLVVHQLPPHVRQLRWISNDSRAKYGPGTKYRKVRLSIPYAVTFAVFIRHGGHLCISAANELYFRNEPLRSKGDALGFPAVLNVSRIKTPKRQRAWICTQYLHAQPGSDWTMQLDALLDHTWNGGFNLSSEAHEGASWYGDSKGIHPSLHPVEKWEQASAADDAFALGVPWKPVPMNVGALMECMFEEHQPHGPKPANLVGRFLNYAQQKKK